MPAVSEKQRKFFGLVRGIQKGQSKGSARAKAVARAISAKSAGEFASSVKGGK